MRPFTTLPLQNQGRDYLASITLTTLVDRINIEEYYLGLILILNKYDFDVDLNDKKVLWVKINSVASVIPHLTMLSMLNSRS